MKLLLICEGEGDDDDLKALTLKVLHETHSWMVGLETLAEPTPAWLEYEPGRRFLRWSDVSTVCDRLGVAPVQRLGRGLGYRAAARALLLLSALPARPLEEGVRVVMVHDSDHVDGWRESLDAARNEWLAKLAAMGRDVDVAVGVAHPEHEAWVLSAVEPTGDERLRWEVLRERLGFDPCTRGDQLTSGRPTDPKDAKRVLHELCPQGARRDELLPGAALELLRSRGGDIGLSRFLEELKARVGSGFGHVPSTRP